jgi:hypothetical protein
VIGVGRGLLLRRVPKGEEGWRGRYFFALRIEDQISVVFLCFVFLHLGSDCLFSKLGFPEAPARI